MSTQTRPTPTRVVVCDLCDTAIDEGTPDLRGSLSWGYIAHKVTNKTRWSWLAWPPGSVTRRANYADRQADPEKHRPRHYDFHTECILRVVEDSIASREVTK